MSPMSSSASERKSPADAARSLNDHVPGDPGGGVTAPETTFGSLTPATGVSVISVVGSGASGRRMKLPGRCEVASAVRPLIVIVLPRDQFGNLEAETFIVRTWSV